MLCVGIVTVVPSFDARADAKQRKGPTFDLKQFHTYALDLGSMGLGPLRAELARF